MRKKKRRQTQAAGRPKDRRTFGRFGDALTAEDRGHLMGLAKKLANRVTATIEEQRRRPRPPWRQAQVQEPAVATRGRKRSRHDDGGLTRVATTGAGAVGVWGPQPRPRPEDQVTRGKRFEFWTLPASLPPREVYGVTVSDEEREDFQNTARAGAGMEVANGTPLFVTVGVDFGTSSTKVVASLPYEAGRPSVAIPAPRYGRVENHPYLWATATWLREDVFLAYPATAATLLCDLKRGMMDGDSGAPVDEGVAAKRGVTRIEAATGYVAHVMCYVRGWLVCNRPRFFKGREPVWFFNVGLPASTYDKIVLSTAYRKMAAAAWMLASSGEEVRVDTIRAFLQDQRVQSVGDSDGVAEAFGVAVTPEVAAGATGFAKSYEGATGLYLMVDVGAATLDTCMFRLNKSLTGLDAYPLLAADVRPLGVEALHWFLENGRTIEGFAGQCDRCLREVIWSTRVNREPSAACWEAGGDLPVFLIGGGAGNELHRDVVAAVGPWLEGNVKGEGIRMLDISSPKIDLPEPVEGFGRLAVAWGLSHPPIEIGRIEPMSAIEDMEPTMGWDWRSSYVSKDQA